MHPWAQYAQIRTLGIKENKNEENISTEQNQKSANPRIPIADGHQGRAADHQQAPCQRTQEIGAVKIPVERSTGV